MNTSIQLTMGWVGWYAFSLSTSQTLGPHLNHFGVLPKMWNKGLFIIYKYLGGGWMLSSELNFLQSFMKI